MNSYIIKEFKFDDLGRQLGQPATHPYVEIFRGGTRGHHVHNLRGYKDII